MIYLVFNIYIHKIINYMSNVFLKNENPFFVKEKTLDIIENSLFEMNNAFDIYSLQKNKNIIYLCGANAFFRDNLVIYEFKNKEFHKKLLINLHKEPIVCCKYFLNKRNKKEYLVSVDNGKELSTSIIFSIIDENNYQKILSLNNHNTIRYPLTLIFNENNNLFYIHPCSFVDTEIVSETKEVYKNINLTEEKIFYYYIWENSEQNKDLVVQCNNSFVYIYDIFAQYFRFTKIEHDKLKGNNYCCIILYNKDNTDILCILNEQGNIVFYDLFKNKVTFIVNIKDDNLVQICQFNEKYLIVLSKSGFYAILDYDNKKMIHKTSSNELYKCKTMKILNHPFYGKYMLIGGFMKGINIYKNITDSVKDKKIA